MNRFWWFWADMLLRQQAITMQCLNWWVVSQRWAGRVSDFGCNEGGEWCILYYFTTNWLWCGGGKHWGCVWLKTDVGAYSPLVTLTLATVNWCFIFSPHLTNASAPPWETGNPEVDFSLKWCKLFCTTNTQNTFKLGPPPDHSWITFIPIHSIQRIRVLLLAFHSILHRFWDIARYWSNSKIANFHLPIVYLAPHWGSPSA